MELNHNDTKIEGNNNNVFNNISAEDLHELVSLAKINNMVLIGTINELRKRLKNLEKTQKSLMSDNSELKLRNKQLLSLLQEQIAIVEKKLKVIL